MSTPDNQSYLAAGINKISAWAPRSPAIRPSRVAEPEPSSADIGLKQQRGGDHRVSHRHRLSLKNYPPDCPPLQPQWFFAVDVPKRKPNLGGIGQAPAKTEKPKVAPKKYSPFSKNDSRAIEVAFNRLAGEEDAAERQKVEARGSSEDVTEGLKRAEKGTNTSLEEAEDDLTPGPVKVPVNEDFLFDVDVTRRELAPAYWLGPVYEVRRGTWFYQEGSTQKPCDENLSLQLEEGYLKVKPWRFPSSPQRQPQRSQSQSRTRPESLGLTQDRSTNPKAQTSVSSPVTPKASTPDLRAEAMAHKQRAAESEQGDAAPSNQPNTHRLFGPHNSTVVTYQDGSTAWLLTDDFLSRLSSTMYQRFAGGGHFAGVKVTRGYTPPVKKTEPKDGKSEKGQQSSTSGGAADKTPDIKTDDGSGGTVQLSNEQVAQPEENVSSPSENRRLTLERQMSSLVSSTSKEDREREEEEVRQREEKEIQNDYRDQEGDEQNREIEHLVLVTHGIGQRLGLRMESVNFVHDVNTFRKTLKAVYGESADLQALNNEVSSETKNCRIQVLPINWRHKLDFPKQSLKHNRKEHDLGDAGFGEEEDYPNLDDISVEGVPAVRNLITDLALDILLYQSPAYKDHITRIVLEECNRIYGLFKERNPSFHGKVSMVGHSLGSAIMFDILCRQEDKQSQRKGPTRQHRKGEHPMKLDFEVEDFYALGSPIGLFQMLKGRTIAARQNPISENTSGKSSSDPFLDPASMSKSNLSNTMGTSSSELPMSSPKCQQLFNIFHPTDPISYRIEPLISPAMASLKPQPLPYTKRGIFGAPVGQGLTGIGARVGQSVSGLWSSFSSGIASSLLNRSLGFTAEDAAKLNGPAGNATSRIPLSLGAGTNASAGVIPTAPLPAAGTEIIGESTKQKLSRGALGGEEGQHPPTLIDSEIETLYSGFQSRRKSAQSDDSRDLGEGAEWQEAEERGRKLRREEAKVRALNSNGRVDYSIQEGAFDISLIAAVASHLSYWADEDVSHFMISQLIARQRIVRKTRSTPDLR